jgi:hypothetical protein
VTASKYSASKRFRSPAWIASSPIGDKQFVGGAMILTDCNALWMRSASAGVRSRGRAFVFTRAAAHTPATTFSVTREKSPLSAADRLRAGVSCSMRSRRPNSTP